MFFIIFPTELRLERLLISIQMPGITSQLTFGCDCAVNPVALDSGTGPLDQTEQAVSPPSLQLSVCICRVDAPYSVLHTTRGNGGAIESNGCEREHRIVPREKQGAVGDGLRFLWSASNTWHRSIRKQWSPSLVDGDK